MSFLDGMRRMFGHHEVSAASLAGYRRLGAQVLDLQDSLREPPGRARAYLYTARCLQLFADKLVEDAFADPAHPGVLPEASAAQAEALYRQVPDLVTAVRQEALAPGGPRDVDLPVVLSGRVRTARSGAVPVVHLRGMLRGAQAVADLAQAEIGGAAASGRARPLLAEALTNRDSATLLVGGLVEASLPPQTYSQADDYVWTTLAYAMGALQELAVPGVLGDTDLDEVIEGGSRNADDAERARESGLTAFERSVAEAGRREMSEAERERERERMQREWRELSEEHHHHEHHEHHEHHHDGWW